MHSGTDSFLLRGRAVLSDTGQRVAGMGAIMNRIATTGEGEG